MKSGRKENIYYVTLPDKVKMVKVTFVDETAKKSLFRQFRVLALSVGLMVLFGFLGHRPGQFLKGWSSYLYNSNVNFNFFLFMINFLSLLIRDYHPRNHIFFIFYNISTILIVCLLTYKFYKKYNLYSIFVDVKDSCTNTSRKEYTSAVLLLVVLIAPALIYTVHEWVLYFILILTEDETLHHEWFSVNLTDQTVVKILLLTDSWATISTWLCFICTSYALSVINIMLSAEYDKIANNVKCKLGTETCLSWETFSHAAEKSFELTSLVGKVNDIFSELVAVSLGLSLASLCTAIYGILLYDGTVVSWGIAITMSITILVLILLPAIILNEKVCATKLNCF